MAATDSIEPAAVRQWPTIDFKELINGKSAPDTWSASHQFWISCRSALVAVKCPLIRSICPASSPEFSTASLMHRITPLALAAVMEPPERIPPELLDPPKTSA